MHILWLNTVFKKVKNTYVQDTCAFSISDVWNNLKVPDFYTFKPDPVARQNLKKKFNYTPYHIVNMFSMVNLNDEIYV